VRVPCGMISSLLRGAAGSGGRVAANLARYAVVGSMGATHRSAAVGWRWLAAVAPPTRRRRSPPAGLTLLLCMLQGLCFRVRCRS
jgi:hypothetical protein